MHILGMNNQQSIEAAGGIIISEKGELLMIFRRGKWDLPKGKIDQEETPPQAAIREVKEETGLSTVELIRHVGNTVHAYLDPYTHLQTEKKTYWYLMAASSDQPLVPQASEDITSINWTKPEQLPALLENSFDTIRSILQQAGIYAND